jgi:hypothetical protein
MAAKYIVADQKRAIGYVDELPHAIG